MFTEESLREELVKKLEKEQEVYLEKQKEQGIEFVIKNAYEIAIRQEIMEYITNRNLDPYYINALLKTDDVVSRAYGKWMKHDNNFDDAFDYPVNKEIKRISDEFYSIDDKEIEQENKSPKKQNKSFER